MSMRIPAERQRSRLAQMHHRLQLASFAAAMVVCAIALAEPDHALLKAAIAFSTTAFNAIVR